MYLDNSQPLQIALAGFGTVGEGVWRILTERSLSLRNRCRRPFEICKIAVKNLAKHQQTTAHGLRAAIPLLTDRLDDLVENPKIDIVVEVIGGCGDAYRLVKRSLEKGKEVVTANKALLAEHGDELFAIARAHNSRILFEASVAGGIPILSALRYGLAAEEITSIRGILNGTTNLILSTMQNDGLSYDVALREAKRLGFAETDPSFDVSGADAAQKLAILTHMGLRHRVDWRSIPRQGITNVISSDIQLSLARGYTIRLIGSAEVDDKGCGTVSVSPMLVPIRSSWGQCVGGNNVIEITTHSIGQFLLQAAGAGALPTASAVVADLLTLAREPRGVPGVNQGWDSELPLIREPHTGDHAYFLRWIVPHESQSASLARAATSALAANSIHGSVFSNAMSDTEGTAVSAWTSSRIGPTKLRDVEASVKAQFPNQSIPYAAYPIQH